MHFLLIGVDYVGLPQSSEEVEENNRVEENVKSGDFSENSPFSDVDTCKTRLEYLTEALQNCYG